MQGSSEPNDLAALPLIFLTADSTTLFISQLLINCSALIFNVLMIQNTIIVLFRHSLSYCEEWTAVSTFNETVEFVFVFQQNVRPSRIGTNID